MRPECCQYIAVMHGQTTKSNSPTSRWTLDGGRTKQPEGRTHARVCALEYGLYASPVNLTGGGSRHGERHELCCVLCLASHQVHRSEAAYRRVSVQARCDAGTQPWSRASRRRIQMSGPCINRFGKGGGAKHLTTKKSPIHVQSGASS